MTSIAITRDGLTFTRSSALASHLIRRSTAPRARIEASNPSIRQFRVDLSDGALDIEVSGEDPDWLYAALASVQELSQLPEGWDSYGARSLTFEAAYGALDLLAQCLPSNALLPSFVPGSNGGIQLEWHRQAGDLEIALTPDGQLSVSYSNAAGDLAWEMEPNQIDMARLQATIESVAR